MVQRLLTAVRRAADEHGMAVLLVEQHVGRALEVADRLLVLNRGHAVMERAAADLIGDPDTLEHAYLRA